MYVIAALLISAPLAVGLTCCICAAMLKKSNDFGDSQGTVNDFSTGVKMKMNERSRRPFSNM